MKGWIASRAEKLHMAADIRRMAPMMAPETNLAKDRIQQAL